MSGPVKDILVYRVGYLGDFIMALPCFHAIKARHPGARVTLLCVTHGGGQFVAVRDIFAGSGLVDETLTYRADAKNRWTEYYQLWREIRRRRFDLLVYLAPTQRRLAHVRRDMLFFRSAGLRRIAGASRTEPVPIAEAPRPLASMPSEADNLLSLLRGSGWDVPAPGMGCMDLVFNERERATVDAWAASQPDPGGRPMAAFGIGSKMPAKLWPYDRYQEVAARLIQSHDIWPVVFGGGEDRGPGLEFVASLGRGAVAAGALGIREAALALSRCALYLGNDSGALHMAAAGGVPCVGVFSARDFPGLWEPYGPGHTVLRETIDCEGCMLEACVIRRNECLTRISAERVYEACRARLDSLQTAP